MILQLSASIPGQGADKVWVSAAMPVSILIKMATLLINLYLKIYTGSSKSLNAKSK